MNSRLDCLNPNFYIMQNKYQSLKNYKKIFEKKSLL